MHHPELVASQLVVLELVYKHKVGFESRSLLWIYTPQTNMEPDKEPFKEDSSLQRTLCQIPCLFG